MNNASKGYPKVRYSFPAIFSTLSLLVFLTLMLSNSRMLEISLIGILVLGVQVIPKANLIAKFYLLIFGCFFVAPIAILGGREYLSVEGGIQSIKLTESQVVLLIRIVGIYMIVYIFSTFCYRVRSENYQKIEHSGFTIRHKLFYQALLVLSGLIVVVFNLFEAAAIYNTSYMDYHRGVLEVRKGVSILLIEVMFIVLAAIGLIAKLHSSLILLLIYVISLMLTGIRMPGATLGFFYCLYFFPFLRKNLLLVVAIMIITAPPVLMFTQALRVHGYEVFLYYDFLGGYIDLVRVLGYTIDSLKAAIFVEEDIGLTVFFRPLDILSVFLDRVLSIRFEFSGGAFGHKMTEILAPDIYRIGGTFGSSSLAEAWYFGGWYGVFALAIVTSFVASQFSFYMQRHSVIFVTIYLIFLPKFIMAIRNELLGWFFEGLIYLALSAPFIIIFSFLFLAYGHRRAG